MKQRLITAAIGLSVFAVVMIFYSGIVFNIGFAVLSVIAVYEILNATGCSKNKFLLVIAMLMAGSIPFLRVEVLKSYTVSILFLYAILLFTVMLFSRKKTTFEELAITVLVSTFYPFALTSLVYMRDLYPGIKGLFYILLVFAVAWGADGGAYFAGRLFGKHKLAPDISPNKTIEGFIGGIISSVIIVCALAGVFIAYSHYNGIDVTTTMLKLNVLTPSVTVTGNTFTINWIGLILFGIIGALVSVLGDLSASMIKREFKIKDFGNIFPGHGGVVDRFDSVFFVAPFLFLLLTVITV